MFGASLLIAKLRSCLTFGGERAERAKLQDVEAAWTTANDGDRVRQPLLAPGINTLPKDDTASDLSSSNTCKSLPPPPPPPRAQPVEHDGPLPLEIPESETQDHAGYIPDATTGTDEEDEEIRRQAKCITFAGEDETDYTRGPIRIISVSDGVHDGCAVLPLNLDFSAKIKEAICAQRELAEASHYTQKQQQVNRDFEAELRSKISKHEYAVLKLEQGPNTSDPKDNENEEEIQQLNTELETLNRLLHGVIYEQENLQASLNLQVQNFLDTQEQANTYLEVAFVEAELLPPQEDRSNSPLPARDLENEYQRLCATMSGDEEEDGANYTLHDCEDGFRPAPLTPEEQAEEDLRQAYENADNELRYAQGRFDSRNLLRERAWQANECLVERSQGAEGESPEAFDVRWVQEMRDITRELIDAEEAFSAARKAAVQGGLDIQDADQTSDFGDEDDGAYPPSVDEQLIRHAPRDRVEAWLAGVETPASHFELPESHVEVDEWAADEVEIGDSYSTVAEPEEKRKIRKWQKACGHGAAE